MLQFRPQMDCERGAIAGVVFGVIYLIFSLVVGASMFSYSS